jgi:hypothetical protein
MSRTIATVTLGSLAALALLASLGGCAPASHGGSASSSHPSPTASPKKPTATSTPTPTGPAPLPANALFRISATVTASNGASADLVQTVYQPIAPDASDTALLNAQCNLSGEPTWQSDVPDAVYLTTEITATLHPGSSAFDNTNDGVLFDFPGPPGAFSGAYGGFEAPCASGFIQIPGTIHGVAALSASDPVHSTYGWANGALAAYGFIGGGNAPGPDLGGTAVVSDCVVQVSASAAAADAKVAAWPSTPYTLANSCDYTP